MLCTANTCCTVRPSVRHNRLLCQQGYSIIKIIVQLFQPPDSAARTERSYEIAAFKSQVEHILFYCIERITLYQYNCCTIIRF